MDPTSSPNTNTIKHIGHPLLETPSLPYNSTKIPQTLENSLAYYWHILIIGGFMLVSLVGNGSTIYIEMQRVKLNHFKMLIIALAIVDIFSCIVVLPCWPFLDRATRSNQNIYFIKTVYALVLFLFGANLSIMLLVSIDRLIAVYCPILYKKHGHQRTGIMLLVLGSFLGVMATLGFKYKMSEVKSEMEKRMDLLVAVFILLNLIAMFVIYIITIIRLTKQGQTISSGQTQQPSAINMYVHKKHVTTLKTFIAIMVCYILSFGAAFFILLRLTDNFFVSYIYFINHINNPFLYLAFNKEFRKDVVTLMRNGLYRWQAP